MLLKLTRVSRVGVCEFALSAFCNLLFVGSSKQHVLEYLLLQNLGVPGLTWKLTDVNGTRENSTRLSDCKALKSGSWPDLMAKCAELGLEEIQGVILKQLFVVTSKLFLVFFIVTFSDNLSTNLWHLDLFVYLKKSCSLCKENMVSLCCCIESF